MTAGAVHLPTWQARPIFINAMGNVVLIQILLIAPGFVTAKSLPVKALVPPQ
jgi:hypothetical protein